MKGTSLPSWELPVTPTLVVSTAIATRDYQDVHHDRDLAQGHGSKDIFVNILSTTGLVQKYVGDWAREAVGPGFVVRSCALRLGALHGAYCVGCCWLLMALLFVGGVMNLIWIAGLALLVLIEKLFPLGPRVSQLTGVALIGWGAFVLVH